MKRNSIYIVAMLFIGVSVIFVQADWFSDAFSDLKDGMQTFFKDADKAIKQFEKETREALHQFVVDPLIGTYVDNLSFTKDNPYKDQVAFVRNGINLNPLETSAVNARLQKVKEAQEKLLDMTLQKPVTVGVSLSGGGFRAMVGGAGTLAGLEKAGLMDAITYISMLSGSTWLGPWWAHGGSFKDFQTKLFNSITAGLEPKGDEIKEIFDLILYKIKHKKMVTAIDFFNLLILNTIYRDFGPDRFKKNLAYQYTNVKDGNMPFFINTAILLENEIKRDIGAWFEFTPVEAGSEWMNAWVPIWAMNRRFYNGQSVDNYFEWPIWSGVYGAALGINLEIVYYHTLEKKINELPEFLRDNVKDAVLDLLNQEMASGKKVKTIGLNPLMGLFDNFTYRMQNTPFKEGDDEILTLTDAGVAMGNPVPPLLRKVRGIDVIIICAYSAGDGVFSGRDLKKVYDYARKEGLPFPEISDFAAAGKRVISVYTDSNPNVPVVVYMPRWNEPTLWAAAEKDPLLAPFISKIENFNTDNCIADDYCDTMNFKYSKEQSEQLSGLTEFNVLVSTKQLLDAIKFKAKQKNNMKQ